MIRIKSGISDSSLIIDENGRAYVSIENVHEGVLTDEFFNKRVLGTPFGDLRTVQVQRILGPHFVGATLDANFWTGAVAGSGAVAVTVGTATLNTGVTANSTATITSHDTARYIPGFANCFRGIIRLDSLLYVNNTKRWGAMVSTTNGYFFEFSSNAVKVVTRKASVDTAVASGDWTGNSRTFNMDTNYHTYEIFYDSRRVYFFIDNDWVHTVENTTALLSDILDSYIIVSNVNAGGAVIDTTIHIADASIYRLGQATACPKSVNITAAAPTTTILKRGPGHLRRIIVNTVPAGAGTLILYDAVSATNPIGSCLMTGTSVHSIEYGCDFFVGLTVVTDISAGDYTIVYD